MKRGSNHTAEAIATIAAKKTRDWKSKNLRSSSWIPDGLLPNRKELGHAAYFREYRRLRMIHDPFYAEYERKRNAAKYLKRKSKQ